MIRKIKISTKGFSDIIDITEKVENLVRETKIENGIVLIFIPASTCAITTIENESGLIKDFKEILEKLIPQRKDYNHNLKWGDGNAFSHLRASLLGPSLVIPVENNTLKLGTWQQIVVCDFDNRPREREVIIQIFSNF